MGGHGPDWRHEVRGDAVDARTAPAPDDASKAMARLAERLAADPFPLLLAGAWGQPVRLLHALDDAAVAPAQKAVAIDLLGDLFSVEAIPALGRILGGRDPVLAQRAAIALGAIGHHDCIPVLMAQLAHQEPERRLAAIKGLGRLAPLHPQSEIVPALLRRLPLEPIPTQTEIVRALGRTPDRRVLAPLRELNRSVQDRARSDSSPELKELKRSLGQTLDPYSGAHTDE
jgi:HEAT repeat protein